MSAPGIAPPIAEKRQLLQMEKAAEAVVELLRPACERIEVAGSIRRRAPWCKDIEIVCVPRMGTQQSGLFDTEETNELDGLMATLLGASGSRLPLWPRFDKNGRPAMGPRYKRLLFDWGHGITIPLDLFSVIKPAQWGVIMTIRTSPADFSRRLVTQVRDGDPIPLGLSRRVIDGHLEELQQDVELPGGLRLARSWVTIDTPGEADLFRALGLDWIEPWDRK